MERGTPRASSFCETTTMLAQKILIVDNDPELTDLLKIALETIGRFTVQSENDPGRAVDAARAFAPHLIVMDVKMPALDGADVAIRLRAEPSLSETPVIFLTGTVTVPQIVTHGHQPGALRFLPKTMPLESLVAIIREILRGSTPATQAA